MGGMKEEEKKASVSTVFNLLLFLVFILCALFTVLIGARVYENIHMRNAQNYEDFVILHYVANKVRQGDTAGNISVTESEGTPVLEIRQQAQGTDYLTRIYAYDGKLRELFTKADADLMLADGLEITDCAGLSISEKDHLLTLKTEGAHPEELVMNIKCDNSGGDGT